MLKQVFNPLKVIIVVVVLIFAVMLHRFLGLTTMYAGNSCEDEIRLPVCV